MSETTDAITDVVELCALLECVGFTLKSLDTSDSNLSQDGTGAAKTVVINCQSSGIHVVLESPAALCSCPAADPHSSGFWQVSGMAGGKLLDKESGSTLLRALPKPYRDRLSKQLYDMIRCIRAINDIESGSKVINKSSSLVDLASKSASIIDLNKSGSMVELTKEANKSASILELGTPEKRHQQLKAETPTRYRSLDTLTKVGEPHLNAPIGSNADLKKTMYRRQSTYTISSTPGSVRRRNKTSSPIHAPTMNMLDSLIEAEKVAEDLRNKLNAVIREFMETEKDDSSISSMLDVSKISVLKCSESRAQFASSPNLSGLSSVPEDHPKSRLKRVESVSTSNLAKPTPETIKSRLKRISPSIFKTKKDLSAAKDKGDARNKLQCILKPRIVTPIRTGKFNAEVSPMLNSSTKKKFSHVKSTIPRPTPKKE